MISTVVILIERLSVAALTGVAIAVAAVTSSSTDDASSATGDPCLERA
ncbi:hypothetical protein [Tsukamurella ocularis]|nr:hypothetical protein [Tsukamurella ocularis]MCS3782081.1 hypothetical protein [Tsukamurella ocularis]MCS3788575.1 hypothetical protein [Tsukamurella ocularis]MCS3852295.1 hypothetical protein [Tsukamurella ocularis]